MLKIRTLSQAMEQSAPPEKTGGPSHISLSGYEPLEAKINNMILAGERLLADRSKMYNFQEGEPVDWSYDDPTKEPGFDMADGFQLRLQNNARLRAQKAAREARINAEALEKKSDGVAPPDGK